MALSVYVGLFQADGQLGSRSHDYLAQTRSLRRVISSGLRSDIPTFIGIAFTATQCALLQLHAKRRQGPDEKAPATIATLAADPLLNFERPGLVQRRQEGNVANYICMVCDYFPPPRRGNSSTARTVSRPRLRKGCGGHSDNHQLL